MGGISPLGQRKDRGKSGLVTRKKKGLDYRRSACESFPKAEGGEKVPKEKDRRKSSPGKTHKPRQQISKIPFSTNTETSTIGIDSGNVYISRQKSPKSLG